jgi:hypothetical protein
MANNPRTIAKVNAAPRRVFRGRPIDMGSLFDFFVAILCHNRTTAADVFQFEGIEVFPSRRQRGGRPSTTRRMTTTAGLPTKSRKMMTPSRGMT